MKNVTISLDETTIAWARKQAGDQGTSLSRFVGDLLESSMRQSREYQRAMRQYLSRSPVRLQKQTKPYPSRQDVNDRSRLR